MGGWLLCVRVRIDCLLGNVGGLVAWSVGGRSAGWRCFVSPMLVYLVWRATAIQPSHAVHRLQLLAICNQRAAKCPDFQPWHPLDPTTHIWLRILVSHQKRALDVTLTAYHSKKWNLGRGLTPEIPFLNPFSIFAGKTPLPPLPPPEGRGWFMRVHTQLEPGTVSPLQGGPSMGLPGAQGSEGGKDAARHRFIGVVLRVLT